MFRQITLLTKASLCNFFDINVVRFSRDKRKRSGMLGLMAVKALLIVMMCSYVGAFTYGYIQIGLGEILPMYLTMISSLLIFFFGIFKAGSVIFQKNYYEMLCSLPVSQTAIVVSRFLSMYLGNVCLAAAVMVPGMVVYGCFLKPGIGFYLWGILGMLFLPFLPMAVATLFGALITGISSRMKHKSVVSAGLSLLLVLGVMLISSELTRVEEDVTVEMIENISGIITAMIGKLYPPAVWLGTAMVTGKAFGGVLYLGISAAIFLLVAMVVSACFQNICQSLYSTAAKHSYQIEEMKSASVLKALCRKEWRRYFASSVYVTNTIIGPIMMVAMAASVFAMGIEKIEEYVPLKGGITGLMPFALAAAGCIMTTTCTSVSMEGKEWWIVKSLPVQAKTLFDSKILLNLTLMAPFYVVSEILLVVALKPGLLDFIWLVVLPVIFMVFACVFGITINLLFPVFNWENEAAVVKQSAASMIGGLGGCLIIILCALLVIFFTQASADVVKLAITVGILGITAWLYRKNAEVDLKEIGE